jgi:hypothetical protein
MRARRAGPEDVEAICRICAEGWRATYADLYAGTALLDAIRRPVVGLVDLVAGLKRRDGAGEALFRHADEQVEVSLGK